MGPDRRSVTAVGGGGRTEVPRSFQIRPLKMSESVNLPPQLPVCPYTRVWGGGGGGGWRGEGWRAGSGKAGLAEGRGGHRSGGARPSGLDSLSQLCPHRGHLQGKTEPNARRKTPGTALPGSPLAGAV